MLQWIREKVWLVVVAFVAIAVMVAFVVVVADSDEVPEAQGPPGSEEPANGDSGGSSTGDGGNGAGAESSAGAGSGSGGGTVDSGGDSSGSAGAAGASGGSAGTTPPPPSGLCAPAEFLGNLPAFVKALGDPNLLPGWVQFSSDATTWTGGPSGPIIGPVGTALGVPVTVLSGFNQAYQPLADEIPDECASISGDPHILTHDRLRYDFQAVGEYLAMATSDRGLEVQIRTVPVGSSRRASSVAGVAVRIDGTELVVDNTAPDLVTINGEPALGQELIETSNGGQIIILNGEVGLIWPDGVTALSLNRVGRDAISMNFAISRDLQGQLEGLMGDADGDPSNDLMTADGDTLPNEFDSIHTLLRESWRVDGVQSMFSGPSVYDATFPEESVSFGAGPTRFAKYTCVVGGVAPGDQLQDCIYDVLVSGDDSWAEVHANNQTRRVLLSNGDCSLDISGPTSMEGYGPERTWSVTTDLSLNGQFIWEVEAETLPSVSRAVAMPNGQLFVIDTKSGARDPLFGAHILGRDGAIQTSFALDPVRRIEPMVAGQSGFVATTDGIAAVSLDGAICWHLVLHQNETVHSMGMVENTLIAALEGGEISTILALEASTGEMLWENNVNPHRNSEAAPALTAEVVITAASDGQSDYVVQALDMSNGELVWSQDPALIGITNIAVVDNTVLVAGKHGGVVALDISDGGIIWTIDPPNGGVLTGMAVAEDVVVAVHTDGIYSINRVSGTILWELLSEDNPSLTPQRSQPVIAGDTVYLYVSGGAELVGLSIGSGAEAIRIDNRNSIPASISGTPVIFDDGLLLKPGDDWGQLNAYR